MPNFAAAEVSPVERGGKALKYAANDMNITHVTKHRKVPGSDNLFAGYTYYRLSKSTREGKNSSKSVVMGLGELPGTTKESRKELARLLTAMIERHELPLSDDEEMANLALHFYVKYQKKHWEEEQHKREQEALKKAAEVKKAEEEKEYTKVKLKSLKFLKSRTVGAETLALWAANKLELRKALISLGMDQEETETALMQIITRAVYPGSELSTVRKLLENSGVCELFNIPLEKINKDRLYRSALRLWDIHTQLENKLHAHMRNLFNLEEKIYLFDLTNTYFEGKMETSEICHYGHSKEKRTDCKIVILAAVVNTDGLLVRTEIFEGNIQEAKTLSKVIGSLEKGLPENKRIIVIDSGFCFEENLKWLKDNGYDYITVMRNSRSAKWEPLSDVVVSVRDNKKQIIKLQKVKVEGLQDTVLLVDSEGKALKEQSMADQARTRFEKGLQAIQAGIQGRGTKMRDAVQRRLGRLEKQYPSVYKSYEVEFEYDSKGRATVMRYSKKDDVISERDFMHGKYLLQTSIAESTSEEMIWTYYNVIRTVEETFKTLKSDLDMRPVYHKTDAGTKAHLNLVVLAYWLVSLIRYTLRKQGINVRWEEILRIGSTQTRGTAELELKGNRLMRIRQNSEPEEKMLELYKALGIKPEQKTKIKFVGHPKINQKNRPPDSQGVT